MNRISGTLFFLAFFPYIYAIATHQTTPSPVSWAIWASVDTLTLLAMKKEGGAPIGQITGAVAGAWVTTILAIIFGKPTMGSVEWISIIGAAAGIILWQKTNNAVLAIVCSQLAIFLGAFPTFVDAYREPWREDIIAWTIWLVSCIFALCAVKKWNLAEALQPITFTVVESVVFELVVIRPLFHYYLY
ncbi:MAG: hypothetical protein WC797_00750 [Candidatus Paceibacterota bacterium]|jgi:hypothetical protein